MKYNFDEKINRINTNSYKWDLYGENYLPLWVADSDFQVPPAVTARLQKRIDHGIYGYFLTGNEVYDVLIKWFLEEYNAVIQNKNWIKLVPGIVPALAVASNIGGGKSITNIPNYCNLLDAPKSAGNEMIEVALKNDNEYYTIDFEALENAITEDTRIFYLWVPTLMQLKSLANLVLQLTEQLIMNQIIEEHSLIMKLLVEQLAHLESAIV